MKFTTTAALALLSVSAFAADAPFCHVSDTGNASCFYYSLSACQMAQRSMGGMCTTNLRPQSAAPAISQQQQYPDVVGSFQRGMAEGQRLRMERERHEAQMQLLQAQTEAAERTILYRCPLEDGSLIYTSTAKSGCVVVGSF